MRASRIRRGVRVASTVVALLSLTASQNAFGGWIGSTAKTTTLDEAIVRFGFGASSLEALRNGRADSKQLDGATESELAAVGIVLVPANVDAVVARFRDLSVLRTSGMAECAGRFSDDPTLDDLTCLEIPAEDLAHLPKARLGDSDVKLSDTEIAVLQQNTQPCTDVVYKQALMNRVRAWQTSGVLGLTNYSDKRKPVAQPAVTGDLMKSLEADRPKDLMPVESFEYWAVERFGSFKPLVDVNSLAIYSGPGAVRLETVQLYASHYCNGLVTSVDLIPVQTAAGPQTLMRLTFRVEMDSLGGFFGGLKRRIGRGKVVDQVSNGLEQVRAALTATV